MSHVVRWWVSSCVLTGVLTVMGQVSVEVVLEQDQLLPSETFRVAVRVSNFSGQTLKFGDDNDWLRFAVETREGHAVIKLSDVPVAGEFELESSAVATKRVDLAPHYGLTRPGSYRLAAVVRVKEWEKEFGSNPKDFSVMTGTKMWEQEFGVPRSTQDGGTPEVRKYALQRALHLKRMKLYFRLTDAAESRVFRVFPLGPMLSFSDPEHQIDRESRLHVLFQTGAKSFNYSVVGPDGGLILRQTHEYTETRPTLRLDREGKVRVWGGIRRPDREDFPPAEEAEEAPVAAPGKP